MSKLGVVIFGCALLVVTAARAEPTPEETAEAALAAADLYVAAGLPEKAAPFAETAVKAAPENELVRARAAAILRRIERERVNQTRVRQRILLAESGRLAAEGEHEKARQLIQEEIEELDPSLLPRAADGLARIHRNWLGPRLTKLMREGWLIDLAIAVALVPALALLLGAGRRWLAWLHRDDWLVTDIQDETKLGIGALAFERLRRWSEEPPARSAGLLNLDALRVQSAPRLTTDQPQIALSAALGELPTLGQVSLGGVAKALEALRRWAHGKRPTVAIAAYSLGEQALVRLTRSSRDGKIHTVAASGVVSLDGLAAAADSASFKMYYLLANEATLPHAEAADQLRLGLEQLRRYVAGREAGSLPSAYETFRRVHSDHPDFEEALFYEGIALDLMERHEEAENLFAHLAEHGHGEVKNKAQYNRAVTKFRKYDPNELQLAIQLLDGLIGPELGDLAAWPPKLDRLAASPIKALAVAAKANAAAHLPIFWQEILFGNSVREPEGDVLARKAEASKAVFGWQHEVNELTNSLQSLDEDVLEARPEWDPLTRNQLRWSIHNARGNVLLNIAKMFLREPHLPGRGEPEKRIQYLQSAYREFETCKLLLPAGVETLTNLATTLLSLSRTPEARSYAEAARGINPDYEYAYYRLAEAWDKEGEKERVRETLLSFRKRPKIPGFKKLFEKYEVEEWVSPEARHA